MEKNCLRKTDDNPDSVTVEGCETPRKKIIKIKRRRLSVGEGKNVEGSVTKPSAFYSCLPPVSSCLPSASAPPRYSDSVDGVGFVFPGVAVPPFIPEMSRIEDCYLHSTLHVPVLRQTGICDETEKRSLHVPVVKQPGVLSDKPVDRFDNNADSIKTGDVPKLSTRVSNSEKISGTKRSDADLEYPGLGTGNGSMLRKSETVVTIAADSIEREQRSGVDMRGGDQKSKLNQDALRGSTVSPVVQVAKLKIMGRVRLVIGK